MARIPNEEIERLKKEIPIERLVTGFGVELKRHGEGSVWALSVSRRQDAIPGCVAGNESVALPGRVQQRRRCDRRG